MTWELVIETLRANPSVLLENLSPILQAWLLWQVRYLTNAVKSIAKVLNVPIDIMVAKAESGDVSLHGPQSGGVLVPAEAQLNTPRMGSRTK